MQNSNISSEQILSFLVENGIINTGDVQKAMTEKHIEKILKQHPFEIWQGKDGRFRTYVEDETKPTGRRMIAKTHEQDLNEYLVRFYEEREKGKQKREQEEKEKEETEKRELTLEKLYPQWQKYKALHTTAKNYIRRINSDWEKYYIDTDIIRKPIKDLKKIDLDTWAHDLIQGYDMTKKQYYNMAIIMRQSLGYAVDLGIIEKNPFSAVHIDGKRMFRRVKKKPDETQVYLKDEIEPLYKMAWDTFYNPNKLKNKLAPLAILFQFQTGVRIGELCVLRYSDIESVYQLHVQRMYRYETHEIVEHTKNFEDRQVLLTSVAQQIIETATTYQTEHGFGTDGYIFSENNTPLSPWSVAYLYNKFCDQLGILRKSSHKARKTFISALIDGKVNINTIRDMVGHADERTTFNNYCFDRNTESEKIDLIEKALAS